MGKVRLEHLLSPFSWITRPIGLMPITCQDGKFGISRTSRVYSTCATVFFFTVGIIHFFQRFWNIGNKLQAGEKILDLVTDTLVYLFSFLNIFYTFKLCKQLSSIFQDLDSLFAVLFTSHSETEAYQTVKHIRILIGIVQVSI
jgi:hypothetical protein